MKISIKLTGMNLSRQINTTISQKNDSTRKLAENTGAAMFFYYYVAAENYSLNLLFVTE